MTSGDAEERLDEVIADLHQVLLASSRRLRARAATDAVSVAQFAVLAYLRREGEATPGRLAEFERVSPPVMTRMIGRLEADGLIARRQDPQDRRQILLALTESGREVVAEGRRARSTWLRERISHLSTDELEALDQSVRTLRSVLLESPSDTPTNSPLDGGAEGTTPSPDGASAR